MLTGYSQATKTRTAQEILDEQPRFIYAILCIRAFAARILKAGMKMQFYPKYRPIFIRELYMHALKLHSL